MALLQTTNVVKRFGGLTAVNKITFYVDEGRIVSIIGPNGAGKTTFFNSLTGIYTPEEGEILFKGNPLVGLRPDQVSARGMSRTFQNIHLFGSMTVIENILVGMHNQLHQNAFDTLFRSKKFNEEEKALLSRINFCDSHKFHEEKRIAIIKQEAISRVIYRYKSMVDELNQLFINNKTIKR